MIDDNYAGKTDDRRKIWTVYSFLTWYDVYFVHDGSKAGCYRDRIRVR